jgi:hypothetical protein
MHYALTYQCSPQFRILDSERLFELLVQSVVEEHQLWHYLGARAIARPGAHEDIRRMGITVDEAMRIV